MSKRLFASLFFLTFVAALLFRTARLDLRPMHHDEANQALKFGLLLEKGEYRYDRADHHGPSLYYLSLPIAYLFSETTLAGLTEETLRLVTATFGLGSLLLLLLFIPMMGRPAVVWGALGLAVSPVMVYYSRFYIQETILVFCLVGFTAALWRYLRRPVWGWAAAAGLFGGLMYATKETSVIAFLAFAGALILTLAMGTDRANGEIGRIESKREIADAIATGRTKFRWVWPHVTLAAGIAVLVSFLLFTSFLRNPRGFLDSIVSFKVYFARAGEAGFHVQPWSYYFQKLAYSLLILILAVVGALAAYRPKRNAPDHAAFQRFLVFFSALTAAALSIIPYKTPWNLLPFYIGFIMLAGNGAVALIRVSDKKLWRWGIFLALAAAFIQLAFQSYRLNFIYPADPRNPYVYAQTSPDFLKLVRRIEDLAPLVPEHQNMLIKVIAGPYETWPLPWYLRSFRRVGYWQDVSAAGDIGRPPVIICSAEEAVRLEPVVGTAYRLEYYGLRPNILLTLAIRDDVWDLFMRSQSQ
jgi:uncharacterized protein (TIGR03663 family)